MVDGGSRRGEIDEAVVALRGHPVAARVDDRVKLHAASVTNTAL